MRTPCAHAESALSALLAACLLMVPVAQTPVQAQQVTGDQVRAAVEAAKRFLLDQQRLDGRWPDYVRPGGTTALATLALLNGGVPKDHAGLQRACEAIRTEPHRHTYVVSLQAQALVAADHVRFRKEIQAAAEWLIQAQRRNGMWGYDLQKTRGDFSNTQFAMLGLHEAAKAGVKVPDRVWRSAERAWVNSQNPLLKGGWAYVPTGRMATGSMTTAGLASLYITGQSLKSGQEKGFIDGRAPGCGKYKSYRPIARGLNWLVNNFSVRRNPGHSSWLYYYLYGLERVGILSGFRHFGRHDWYRAGAESLVKSQLPDGTWKSNNPIVDTAFGLLFLAKGHRPLLFQKLKWCDSHRWQMDRNDIAHLVAFIGDRLGEPAAWQVVELDASVEDWLSAPILYFNGHDFPEFDDAAVEKLKQYVEQGGTILAEACCGKQKFRDGFREFAAKAFADYDLRRLPQEHPVFQSMFKLNAEQVELHGISLGCRTSIFFSPNDLSCLWEQGNVAHKSERAFKTGTNIATYATGLEPLADRLDVVRLIKREKSQADKPLRGAVYIAQLMHNGDWRPNPKAIPNLADYLRQHMGVDVIRDYASLKATDPELAQHPIVYMTGHFSFKLDADEVSALRQHLERGGFLFADACCGRKAFDTSFRELARELFPDQMLKRLPANNPIIAGQPGIPLSTVTYKKALRTEQPNLNQVRLEGIERNGRMVIVYSPFSINCGLDGHKCFTCRGLVPDDATKLAANIVLHALSY